MCKYRVTFHDITGNKSITVEDGTDGAIFYQDLIDRTKLSSKSILVIEHSNKSNSSITVEKLDTPTHTTTN